MSTEEIIHALEVNNSSKVFYIGTSSRGITIFKQQVRALNLIYSLQEQGLIHPKSKICIIGGGISGITASAACLSIDCTVFLYEKQPTLLHLQTGCNTRWVHPNIYNWPDKGSQFPYAGLPLLDWHEGYASEVSQQILNEYELIKDRYRNQYHEFLGSEFTIDFKDNKVNQEHSLNTNYRQYSTHFDILILATGFGLESGVLNKENPLKQSVNSYWRNDDLDQPYLGFQKALTRTIIITGSGDGACIDLFRSTLKSFHQGRLINDLLSESPEIESFLSTIKESDDNSNPNDWLYYKFGELSTESLNISKEYLKKQVRNDTNVIMLGRQKNIFEVFQLNKMSIFNAFVTYLLYSLGAFTYYGTANVKKINKGKSQVKDRVRIDFIEAINGKLEKIQEYDVIITRHGPKKGIEESLRGLGVSSFSPSNIDETSMRIWPPGWPATNVDSKIEFVPPVTRTIIITFCEILASNLIKLHDNSQPHFRLSYHRFIDINDNIFFQQLSRYAGTSTSRSKKTLGRIFPAKFGIVGYTAKIGQPVLLMKESDFDETVDMMGTYNLTGGKPIKSEIKSMLCIPFFSPTSESKDNKGFINSVIYFDSSEKFFFTDEVINIILNSCEGLINSLETMKEVGEIKVADTKFKGVEINFKNDYKYNSKSIKIGTEISNKFEQNKMTFKTLSSFDIYA